VAQSFDGIEMSRSAGWINAEDQAHGYGQAESQKNGPFGNDCRGVHDVVTEGREQPPAHYSNPATDQAKH
ncbi:uncharacterized protein METZ01_LOCUS495034, partial [marine metagenome]